MGIALNSKFEQDIPVTEGSEEKYIENVRVQ